MPRRGENIYKPKLIRGKVKGIEYPIDGRELFFSLWDYDNYESYHLGGGTAAPQWSRHFRNAIPRYCLSRAPRIPGNFRLLG